MRAQLKVAGPPGPKVIGIDEVSIRKGHAYRIVVSDLERRRPIWFGGLEVVPQLDHAACTAGRNPHQYARLDGKSRRFIKGEKYALLSDPQNREGSACKNLKLLLAANKHLNTVWFVGVWQFQLNQIEVTASKSAKTTLRHRRL
jgi:transposase